MDISLGGSCSAQRWPWSPHPCAGLPPAGCCTGSWGLLRPCWPGALYEEAEGGRHPVLPSTCPAVPEGLLQMEPGALSLRGRAQPGTSCALGSGWASALPHGAHSVQTKPLGLGAAVCFKGEHQALTKQEGLTSPLSGRPVELVTLRSGHDYRRLTWGLALSIWRATAGRPVGCEAASLGQRLQSECVCPQTHWQPHPKGSVREAGALRICEQGLCSCERGPGEPPPLPPMRTQQELCSRQNRARRPLRRRLASRLCVSTVHKPQPAAVPARTETLSERREAWGRCAYRRGLGSAAGGAGTGLLSLVLRPGARGAAAPGVSAACCGPWSLNCPKRGPRRCRERRVSSCQSGPRKHPIRGPQQNVTSRRRGRRCPLFCGHGGCRVCRSSLGLSPLAFLSRPTLSLPFFSSHVMGKSREAAGLRGDAGCPGRPGLLSSRTCRASTGGG